MASKKSSPSGFQDNNNSKTQIILAIIGLIGTLGVAYLGYLQGKQPSAPTDSVTVPSTNTPPITATDTLIPTLKPSVLVPTVTFTPTPLPLIASTCLSSDIWEYTLRALRNAIPTDKCWKIQEFLPTENGVQIVTITAPDSGEQQPGFYTILNGNVDIEFVVNISAFKTQKSPQGNDKKSNLAFGIVEGSQFNTSKGVFVFYNASKPGVGIYDLQVIREGIESNPRYNGELNTSKDQTIRFNIKGKSLTMYIDGNAVAEYSLDFKQNSFYFGYRLFEQTELNASISKLKITQK